MSGSVYKNVCPHCGQPMRVRNSVAVHPLLRNVYLQCNNLACGATFAGQMEITATLSPASKPNPAVDLPLADAVLRRQAHSINQSQQLDLEDLLTENKQEVPA